MNLVGKIFIVLILVMSLVFMSFVIAVYATHRNWRDEEIKKSEALVKSKHDNDELKSEYEKLKKENEFLKNDREHTVAKALQQLKQEQEERKNLEKTQAAFERDQREAVATMKATQEAALQYRKELEDKRNQYADALKDRDNHFKEVVRLTDELHQAINEKELLRKRSDDLGKDLAKYKDAVRYLNVDINTYKEQMPPDVEAVVLATPGGKLVEISLGSDAGLRKGHQLHIVRLSGGQSTYVGRVEVVRTSTDRSVCTIDPKSQTSNVMVGDRVLSHLK
jgi:hypothetical protein